MTSPSPSRATVCAIDERGRTPWFAQKSSANANDLRGAILRVKPR